MIRAVLDTNVLISAVISDGMPNRLVAAGRRGTFEAVCSPYIIDEFRRIMVGKLGMDSGDVDRIALAIARASVMTPVFEASDSWCDDDADDAVIETALRGRATYLVTGDRRLLQVRVEGLTVVTVAQFAESLTG